jgi:hypothetical protein
MAGLAPATCGEVVASDGKPIPGRLAWMGQKDLLYLFLPHPRQAAGYRLAVAGDHFPAGGGGQAGHDPQSLLGASGAGKTSLLRVMAGLAPATCGEVVASDGPRAEGDVLPNAQPGVKQIFLPHPRQAAGYRLAVGPPPPAGKWSPATASRYPAAWRGWGRKICFTPG